MPLTLGHENAGRVVALGAGVQAVKEGDSRAGRIRAAFADSAGIEPLDHINEVYARVKKGQVDGRVVITP